MKTRSRSPWKGRAYLRKRYPGAFPLSEGQVEVLEGLAKQGCTNAYRLAHEIDKAYSFVFNSLKELERRKMVILKRIENTEKGTKAKIYDLDLRGILLVMYREMLHPDKVDRRFLRSVLSKYGSLLPLVFGKFESLESSSEMAGKIAWFCLKRLADFYAQDPQSFNKGMSYVGSPIMELEQKLTWFFYFQDHHFKYGEEWLSAIRQDDEIKLYVINELRAYQVRLLNLRDLIENTISSLEVEDWKK